MDINQIIHGFKIERIRKSDELGGTLYEMRHVKTGAQLAFLDNGEDNKLFSAAFKTLPYDDTGVFHILEHSVLSGSENYPVKEPFLDLLKSSMNTFLNAMTFPDKTLYPVSSRNEQDFINLTRVYLDAVFLPAIYTNESIFRQEGWHYETDEKGVSYNGVVFNEMKGELSSVDGLMERIIKKNLFPDNAYGFESGGDPRYIPDLTYEDFLNAHREFYSPSNARFYLDGDVPLERVLAIIDDEYLSRFDYIDKKHEIAVQKPIEQTEMSEYYAIGEEESGENKTQISISKVFASWEQRERIMAYSLIASYLAGSNEAPLKRAILEKGIAQDVEFVIMDGIAQPYYTILFRNTDPGRAEEIKQVYSDVLKKQLAGGIDNEALTGCLNRFEFKLRETEEPKGLYRNIAALASWLYGGDMLLYLENGDIFARLRSRIETDGYRGIIEELLDAGGTLTLTMLPSKTKGEENRAQEHSRVTAEYESFTDSRKAAVQKTFDDMRAWQDTPDPPEAKATLPVLSLSDVGKTPMWLGTEEYDAGGVKILYHKLPTNGIVHCNLFFDVSDENFESISALSMLTNLLGLLPTQKYTSAQLQKEIKKTIGSLDFNIEIISDNNDRFSCKAEFVVSFSVLRENFEDAARLVAEILLNTKYDEKSIINENMLQGRENLYQALMSYGHAFAIMRTMTQSSASAFVKERSSGFELFRWVSEFIEQFDVKIDGYIDYLKNRTRDIFVSSRLIIGETSENRNERISFFADVLPKGQPVPSAMRTQPLPPKKEAVIIPSDVSYAAYGANIGQYGCKFDARLSVVSILLSYGYLWNEIRVHGGAYGAGFRAGRNGNVVCHTYRDPDPLNSVEVCKNIGGFIREFVGSDETIDRYIISSVAAAEPLQSTARQGFDADIFRLSGVTYEDKLRDRTQMLQMKKQELLELCEMFDSMAEGNSVCIVGSQAALSNLDDGWEIYRL